ncbi:MAG: hypothetical protein US54_C0001G0040 [Candidatus Roizmanbacteria bacterium GW2011_GWA2_37_7]|uniref:LPXTG cell wall anchor domain-containing protein n=1 Tax=Candidatus Roizmanbacteria bacterium GW2011_GWA2_37_7 TaxID=1618481 RepID=A0A0G0HK23_9BACT|nr:MAG: hypothetical protein US54_C0001G0040 [Candidatus Roizmanbacteria bacterium GW2011_GWA2_37_7]
MEFNRLVSLVLGFIVLILAFVWISNRFRAKKTPTQTNQPTITITIAPTGKEEKQDGGWNPLAFLFKNNTPTPTNPVAEINIPINEQIISPTPQTKVKVVEGGIVDQSNSSNERTIYTAYNQNIVHQIPETGAATALLPILSVLFAGGMLIKKSS